MSILPSLMPYNEVFTKGAGRCLTLIYSITGAKTVAARPLGAAPAAMVVFDAIASQTTIDNFLGTSSEFTIAQFDATSMGTDAMGIIVNMKGQAADLLCVDALMSTSTTTIVQKVSIKSTTLTDTSLTTECAVGASGNIAAKIIWANSYDGLTSGLLRLNFYFVAK
jgi:hypothetical protein